MAVIDYGSGIYAIDLLEEGKPFRSSAYLIKDKQLALVDTGSARSHETLLAGLQEVGVSPQDIDHIIVTHVHLDHAGGTGQMMQASPRAVVHAHARAATHLIDPSRLAQGVRAVYGERTDELFGTLVPIEARRVVVEGDDAHLKLGRHTLTFYDTPGHAKHHLCVWDSESQGLFSGDMVGIRYRPEYTGWDFVYGFPTTSPVDFDPEVMLESLARMEKLKPQRIFHTHFGETTPAAEAFHFTRRGVEYIRALIEQLPDNVEYSMIHEALQQIVLQDIKRQGYHVQNVNPLALDMMLDAQGILVYIQKKAAGKL
ncbi:MAG: MBL fold metallo-hydrolase [Sulfobacillus thermotolerans]|nr:MBL fold metallo-hydrolase [Sulfobacillus thermotolerans]